MVFCQIIVIHTYFLKREETTPTTLYVSRVVRPDDTNPTLRKCIYYISQLVINDNNVGNRLGHVVFDNDDDDDDVMTIVMVTPMILMTPTTLDHLMMILVMIMVMMIIQGRGREHQRPVVKKQLQVRPKELLL
jgi:hypothetical protein